MSEFVKKKLHETDGMYVLSRSIYQEILKSDSDIFSFVVVKMKIKVSSSHTPFSAKISIELLHS